MAQIRTATAHWQGTLTDGSGSVTSETGTFGPLQTTWRARAEASDTGLTSPEELLAAAWASCFSMASSNELAKAGFPVTSQRRQRGRDRGQAGCRLHRHLGRAHAARECARSGRGDVPDAVGKAKDGCPISRALKGNVEVTLDAALGLDAT